MSHLLMASRKYCSVPCCGEKVGPMYKFPKDAILRELWKSECKITRSVSNYMLVCHRHFGADDVDLSITDRYSRLKKGAVPKQNLPDSVLSKGRRNCIIHTCLNGEHHNVTLHFFPKSAVLQHKWASVCKVPGKVSRNTRICSSHFSDDHFICGARGLKTLKTGVTPSRNLPISFPSPSARHTSRQWTVFHSSFECDEEHGRTLDIEQTPHQSEDMWIQRFIYGEH